MHLATIRMSLALLAASLSIVSGAAVERPTSIEGRIAPARFTGELNGEKYDIRGTVSEVIAQLEARHPGALDARAAAEAEISAPLTKLNKRNKDGINCDPRGATYYRAIASDIKNAIAGLAKVQGSVHADARKCNALACAGGSAIWLCNDNNYGIDPQPLYISTYAQDILDQCTIHPVEHDLVIGQEFDTDNYNVFVRGRC